MSNSAAVSEESAFLEVGSPATVAWFAPCQADQLFLGVSETSRSYLQSLHHDSKELHPEGRSNSSEEKPLWKKSIWLYN